MPKAASFCGLLCLLISGCGDAIYAKRQVVELRLRRDNAVVQGASVALAYSIHGRDYRSTATDQLRKQGHAAITDKSGVAKVRVCSNSLVGGVFPIATVQGIWRDLHPPDRVTGRAFFVRVETENNSADGEFIIERGARATVGEFEVEVMAIGRPVDAEKVGCSVSDCEPGG